MPSIGTKSIKSDKKYSKLLNNLLDIKGRDKTIFTRINNTDSFDVNTKFGNVIQNKIILQKSFTLNLQEQDLNKMLTSIKASTDPEEIINLYDEYKERLFGTKKLLLRDPKSFVETKKELIEKIKEKIQKTTTRWKQFQRKTIDTNTQDNVWPLHVATLFITIKTNRREIYAPLLLKETTISVVGDKITIKSEDSWKINEKLIFLLNDDGYSIDENANIKEMDIHEALEFLGQQFSTELNVDNLSGAFSNMKSKDIKNTTITFQKGVVFGLFKPSGGHLRKTMMSIINNDEMDDIIDVDPIKRNYEERLDSFIKEDSKELYRIQPSNFSQDRALSSSLIQDTIIWGPPGTGKSQVISNIIANIMMKGKSAIVMSQKKAALDVLKKRLGAIAPFALFILNDNKMIKAEFYKPLQKFIEMVEYSRNTEENERQEIITKDELSSLEVISSSKKNGDFDSFMKLTDIFKNDLESMTEIHHLDKSFSYPEGVFQKKDYIKMLASENNIDKKGFFIFKKFPANIIESASAAQFIKSKYNHLDINTIKNMKAIDKDVAEKLIQVPDNLHINNEYNSDETYISSYLGTEIINKIANWKTSDRDKLKDYNRFANAVRAGRRLPYKFANDHMSIIRELFPIVVTTPETSFINWERNVFDYAILDESSQMFLEIGLPILYLAKIKILAGDTQQMKPSRWFATRDEAEDEEDVVENAESLLDYAFDKGVYKIMLNQNYRSSSASLMTFSSKTFYESHLEVIDNNNIDANNAIEVININGKWESGVNVKEAKKVIEIAEESLKTYEKIIILTFNSMQRQYIEKEIIEANLKLQNAIEEEQLMIRNIENIQGDEADLVIVSIVYDETTATGSTYVSRSGGKNALNVAISRAKDKMIVVKSVTSTNIRNAKSDDFKVFKEWLAFLDLSSKKQREYSIPENEIEVVNLDVDSGFELDVIEYIKDNILTNKKMKLISQYPVGSKKIDIGIVDSNTKFVLGIEVDGYRYHGGMGYEKYLQDASRQEFLENKGYPIYRIREIDWKINRDKIKEDISILLNK